jgi:hypothetical protein
VEMKGSLNDFTGSEATPGLRTGKRPRMALYLRRKMAIPQVVNAPQGFVGLEVSTGLSGPAGAG